ncbi:hypothetical protein HN937_20900, partial [Candidatus Poribacteria bacterium]|nr:hypothetical protein [Candidatus Poribacteria bacterium]
MARVLLWCSLALVVSVGGASAAVEYLREDLDTQGSWRGVYGESGGVIFEAGGVNGQNVPGQDNDQFVDGLLTEYVDGSPSRWNWASAVDDERGLEFADEAIADRVGACQFGNGAATIEFTVDAN